MPKQLSEINEKDVDGTDGSGRTQLMRAMCPLWFPPKPSQAVIDERREAVVRRLLDLGADVCIADKRGWTALHFAAQEGLTTIAASLLDAGADVDATTQTGGTPLWRAVREQNNDLVELLMAHGADAGRADDDMSALSLAHAFEDADMIRTLEAKPASRKKRSRRASRPAKAPKRKAPKKAARKPAKWRTTCEAMWESFVPASGQADTVQGELLRAVEKLRDEALRNGNVNWSAGHRRLHRYIGKTLRASGTLSPASESALSEALATIGKPKQPASADAPYDRICRIIAAWYTAHPDPIPRERDPALKI